MSGEIIFYGAKVEVSDDGQGGWANVPGVTQVGFPEEAVDYVETTSLDSVDGYKEYITGMKDAGEVSMEQNYTSAAMAQLQSHRGAKKYYRVTFALAEGQATGDATVFQAIRTGSPVTNGVGDPVTLGNTLRSSGAPQWTAGTLV